MTDGEEGRRMRTSLVTHGLRRPGMVAVTCLSAYAFQPPLRSRQSPPPWAEARAVGELASCGRERGARAVAPAAWLRVVGVNRLSQEQD